MNCGATLRMPLWNGISRAEKANTHAADSTPASPGDAAEATRETVASGGRTRPARDAASAELPKKAASMAEASLLLREHGKETCKYTVPRYEECPLTASCAWYRARARTR